ncbi:hypothetical protein Tco_0933731 [Tanacetum coccineum]
MKFPENSLEVLKLLENSVEVLKILENKLESMKILENKLESLKLQENQPVDGLVPPSTQKNYIRKCFREAVKEIISAFMDFLPGVFGGSIGLQEDLEGFFGRSIGLQEELAGSTFVEKCRSRKVKSDPVNVYGVFHMGKLNAFNLEPITQKIGPWYVSVFTLSSRTWYKLDSYYLPCESIRIKRSGQAVVGGKISWVIDMPEETLIGQCLPPYYISHLGDCIIISGSFKFVDFSIIYACELQVDEGEVSCLDIDGSDLQLTPVVRSYSSTHVEPSPLTPNPVTIIPGPAGIVQLSSSTRVEPSFSTSNPVRIILGHAGLKVVEDVGEDTDFNNEAWVRATNYMNAFGGTVTGCLGDIDNFLKKGKLEQVVAIVKSCSSNAFRDLNVTLKDLSGTVPRAINYKVLDVGSYGKDITIGATMILANVSVLTPKPSKHYLNITKRHVVKVFRKDTVPGSGSG